MRQVLLTFCLMTFFCFTKTEAFAYDFESVNEDGVTLYYNYINDGIELELTAGRDKYSKDTIKIPSEVTHMNRTRKVTRIGDYALRNSRIRELIIPETVKSIGKKALQNSYIKKLIIPNSVETIEEGALSCLKLEKLTVGNGLKKVNMVYEAAGTQYDFDIDTLVVKDIESFLKIEFYNKPGYIYNFFDGYGKNLLFNDYHEITDLVYPEGITTLGNAISKCMSIRYVKIPQSVKTINNLAFYRCYNLMAVDMHDDISTIGQGAFGDTKLSVIKFPKNLKSIEAFAFRWCKLKSVNISNKVTIIGNEAFYECPMSSVTIPESVTEIHWRAFYSDSLLTVISKIVNPNEISEEVFSKTTLMNATLYVPKGTKDKYKATNGWKDFIFIEEGTGGGGTTTPKKCERPTISYSNGKLKFTSGTEGASCQYNITDTDIKAGSGNEVQLTVTYNISVYATKAGYDNSETVTATLCWVDVSPKTEGIGTSIANVRANPVLIQSNGGVLNISGINDGADIVVYSVSGQMVGSSKAMGNQASVFTNMKKGEIAIVKIGDKSVKVVMQ